jgi:hypothetical protein
MDSGATSAFSISKIFSLPHVFVLDRGVDFVQCVTDACVYVIDNSLRLSFVLFWFSNWFYLYLVMPVLQRYYCRGLFDLRIHNVPLLILVTWWTIDWVWIGNWIYWTLWCSAWLHFTVRCYTRPLVSTVTSSLPLLGSGFSGGPFLFFGFPNGPRTSATSVSLQQLTTTELQQSSNSLTHH